MDRLAASSDQGSPSFFRKWVWILAAAAAGVVLLALIFGLPRLIAVYELYWSRDNIQRLFYEDLGLSHAWSSFIAVVGSFFYALAWVPLTLWTYRVLAWRFSASQFALAFACWVFVYGHVPLLHALLGSEACFNQRTGEPMKWYVQDADGRIVLFDSAGFDTATGVAKRLVTSEICNAFARQRTSDRPRRITINVREVEFFDPANGRPRVWYLRKADGELELFDSKGYHPVTSEPLLPVTKEVVGQILKRAADSEAAVKRAEAAAEAKRKAEEVERQLIAAAKAKAEEERKRAEAAAAAKRKAEEVERQLIAATKAEEERKRAEAAAAEKRKAEEFERQRRAPALGTPGTASAQSVRQTLQQFGLLGTWADDCSQPPAGNNFHTVYAGLPNGAVQRTYYNAPGKIYNQYVLERVNWISSDQIFYQQKGSAGRIDVVLKKVGNRYHVLSSQNENGKVYVREGIFTENTSSPGKESPWQTKCRD